MTRLLAALCLLAAAAYALPARYLHESQALTRSAPTLATEGMGLLGLKGFRVSVCATSGNTLSGAGSLRAYLYHPDAALWMRNPSLDLTVSTSGVRCLAFPDFAVGADLNHRVLFAADGVTVSGGTTVTVYHDGVQQ